jgi:hypothetical protein
MRPSSYRLPTTGPKTRFVFDQTIAIGGATAALLGYIVYHFVYPLISKGLLF